MVLTTQKTPVFLYIPKLNEYWALRLPVNPLQIVSGTRYNLLQLVSHRIFHATSNFFSFRVIPIIFHYCPVILDTDTALHTYILEGRGWKLMQIPSSLRILICHTTTCIYFAWLKFTNGRRHEVGGLDGRRL